ncbi:MAG TPA: zinc ribbon domain-containing protein [Verrucomicrobiae bacterium]|nr:zinc ribbon domain-containing protein [Verrucomicrobiae bacterium]
MKATSIQRYAVFFLFLWGIMAQAETSAPPKKVDLSDLIHETQKSGKIPGVITLVWWVPEEFWRVSLSSGGKMTPEATERMLQVFRPYTMVGIVDGTIGPFGAVTYTSNEEARAAIQLQDTRGHAYPPLDDDVLSADVKNFLQIMKPLLTNMMGSMGKNFHFFLFPAEDFKGRALADPKSEGSLTIAYKGKDYKWRLPLASLLPTKTCPKCLEQLPGNYKFCPWDGAPLPEAAK